MSFKTRIRHQSRGRVREKEEEKKEREEKMIHMCESIIFVHLILSRNQTTEMRIFYVADRRLDFAVWSIGPSVSPPVTKTKF